MRHGIWVFPSVHCIERSRNTSLKNNLLRVASIITWVALGSFSGCIPHYSLSGAATNAKTIVVDQFFNNTDLGPANLAQDFTNRVKDYFQQNSSLRVIPENGELQIDGVVSEYRLNPVAPTATPGAANAASLGANTAALTRLTIVVKVNYVDTTEPKNSFKDKSFSFFQDFDNGVTFTSVQEDLQKKIFDQILIDIFNATVANW